MSVITTWVVKRNTIRRYWSLPIYWAIQILKWIATLNFEDIFQTLWNYFYWSIQILTWIATLNFKGIFRTHWNHFYWSIQILKWIVAYNFKDIFRTLWNLLSYSNIEMNCYFEFQRLCFEHFASVANSLTTRESKKGCME